MSKGMLRDWQRSVAGRVVGRVRRGGWTGRKGWGGGDRDGAKVMGRRRGNRRGILSSYLILFHRWISMNAWVYILIGVINGCK